MNNVENNQKDTKKYEEISRKLQEYMNVLEFFEDDIDDYIYIYDLTAERVFLTDKIREKFPIPPAAINGNAFSDWNAIVYPKDRELMDHYRKLLIHREIDSFNITYRIIDYSGNKVWVRVKGTSRKQDDTQSLLIVGHITEIKSDGMIDRLTGLFNIDQFRKDINSYLKTSNGYLMILDIDNFKDINMTQGRNFGDSMLKSIANILDKNTLYPMQLYRLDGDCFAIIFDKKEKQDVENFYTNIKKVVNDICTLSAGVVYYDCKQEILDEGIVYLYAESALDYAKKERKDTMIFFSVDDYQKNLEQVEFLNEMKKSIKEEFKGFRLEYQPQINKSDFSLYGAEALVRYDSSIMGNVNPIYFIPLLERTGYICTVGKWILRKAIFQCKEWRKYIPDMHISVNMSYLQLEQKDITNMVLDLLSEADLPGEALTIELTESIQLQNYTYFNKIFSVWKQHGIKISIDDFGTGYSSLSYLKRIEIDEVKIDRCFVDHVQCNAYNLHLLRNMIELAHSVGIKTCCEGVETIEELTCLYELNTDIFQGYLFSKPCAKDDFEQIYMEIDSKPYQERKIKEKEIKSVISNRNIKELYIS